MVSDLDAAAGKGMDSSGPEDMAPTGSALPPEGACLSWGGPATSNLTPRLAASAETRFIGGSLKARATRSDLGAWNTSAVGPYCSSSPASSTAV